MNLEPFRTPISAEALNAEDRTLIRWLKEHLASQGAQSPDAPPLSGNAVKRLIETGKITVDGRMVKTPTYTLKPGQEVAYQPSAPRADKAHLVGPHLYFVDSAVVVAEKPIGILTLPFEEDRDTLLNRVQRVIPRIEKKGPIHPLRAVHRLDKEASGLVVMARNITCQRLLQEQFSEHTVERAYLALVNGVVNFEGRQRIQSVLIADRGDGLKGSRQNEEDLGKEAVTWIEVIERLPGATLLRCELETGRTHQIRIHCAELGHPLVGDPVYIRDYRRPLLKSPRMMLHATALGFDHPITQVRLRYQSPMPPEMETFIKGLRRQPGGRNAHSHSAG